MLIDWFTVGAQAVNFLILVWLMERFVYRPVLTAIEQRETKIAGELKAADDAKAQAAKEREDLRVANETLQGSREKFLQEAVADAQIKHKQLLDEGRKEAQALRINSLAALRAERTELAAEIVSGARREAFALTRKTLAGLADTTLEDRMLQVFVRRVTELSDAQRQKLVAPTAGALAKAAVLRSAFDLTLIQQCDITAAFRIWPCEGATLTFEHSPGLVSGVELIVDGQKLAWNVTAYLAAVEETTQGMVTAVRETANSAGDVKHAA